MAKFSKRIERMITELENDQKIIDMHGLNIVRREALRSRRAAACSLLLAAYRFGKKHNFAEELLLGLEGHANHEVMVYKASNNKDDQEANRARLVAMRDTFDDVDDFMDRVREKVDILDPFYQMAYEVYSERKDKEIADLESRAQKALCEARKGEEEAKQLLESILASKNEKRGTLSLKRAADKRENKIITVGNKKAYQVGKGDWKHRNGVIIDN